MTRSTQFGFLILFFLLIFSLHAVSSASIPFSGNHTYDNLQRLLSDIPDNSDYVTDYQNAFNQTPSDIETAEHLGKIALKAGNASEAERQFSYILSRDKTNKNGWTGLFVSLNLQERYDELLNQSMKRLNSSPYDEQAWLEKAWAFSQKNEAYDALDALKQVSKLNAKNIFAHYYAAWNYEELRQNQNAIREFEKVSLLSPEYGGVEGNIGFLLVMDNQYKESLPHLEKALEWYPNWTEARRTQGMVLYHLDKKDEAMKTWDEVLQIDPKYSNAYLSKGEALIDMGKNENALSSIDTGLSFDANNTDLMLMKGDALIHLKRYEEAKEVFENATAMLQTIPDTEHVYNRLYALWKTGVILEYLGNESGAKEFYTQSLEKVSEYIRKDPEYGIGWHLKANILRSLGENVDAQVAEEKATELTYPEHFYL